MSVWKHFFFQIFYAHSKKKYKYIIKNAYYLAINVFTKIKHICTEKLNIFVNRKSNYYCNRTDTI